MSIVEELKRCPFCGEVGKIIDYSPTVGFIITCTNKNCILVTSFKTIEEAIEAWNKREVDPNEQSPD